MLICRDQIKATPTVGSVSSRGCLDAPANILPPPPVPFNPSSRQFLLTLPLCAILGCKIEGNIVLCLGRGVGGGGRRGDMGASAILYPFQSERKKGKEGVRKEGRKEGGREGGKKEGRKEGGREGGKKEGRKEGGREGGKKEGRKEGGREVKKKEGRKGKEKRMGVGKDVRKEEW